MYLPISVGDDQTYHLMQLEEWALWDLIRLDN